eukprot:TRINITY_DN2365_c0_g1_i1.p1 TRINITY_DN2365_c0_g1~~TRINITY_DN2365_c0_g1_i1.p1  ORF type:complete len:347 (-),score=28.32 TRINITY_DN2365_c0_g1_i1:129-1169(-)
MCIRDRPHLIEVEEAHRSDIKPLYKKCFTEKVIWLHIVYFSEKSFEYYFAILSTNTSSNKLSAVLLTGELKPILKTTLMGVLPSAVSQIKWKDGYLSILVNEKENMLSKIVRMRISINAGFVVTGIETLEVKVAKFVEHPGYSLRMAVSNSGQLLIFNSWPQPVLSIEFSSHSEKMQILKTPIKFSEEELTVMEHKFAILQKEHILTFRVVDLNEMIESRNLKLWVLTNYAIYLVQCNLTTVNTHKEKSEATSTIIDHMLFSSLDIAQESIKLHWVDKDSVVALVNGSEFVKFGIKTVVDSADFQVRRSIYVVWRKKAESKVAGFLYDRNRDEIVVKHNAKLIPLQ